MAAASVCAGALPELLTGAAPEPVAEMLPALVFAAAAFVADVPAPPALLSAILDAGGATTLPWSSMTCELPPRGADAPPGAPEGVEGGGTTGAADMLLLPALSFLALSPSADGPAPPALLSPPLLMPPASAIAAHPPSSIPFLALGAWILTVGWFGFNVMSAQTLDKISGLVAVNSLMAMVGGTLAALLLGKNDPGFVHNGPLAGLVAVCAGSDLMHPLGALVVGAVAGAIFVAMFTLTQNKWKIDDVLGVWPLHGLCGAWGGVAAGIFGSQALGGLGGVSLGAQLIGTTMGVLWAAAGGLMVYGALKATVGLRLSQEEEFDGADLSIHRISATPEREANW